MKKSILTLLFIMTASLAMAQKTTASQLFKTYKGKAGVEYVHIPKMLIKLGYAAAKNNAEDKEERQMAEIMKRIDSINVLSLEDCSAASKQSFEKDAEKLKIDGYESLIKANDEGEKVNILLRQKGDIIHEMLILAIDNDDCALVQINGKIRPEDIQQLINNDFTE